MANSCKNCLCYCGPAEEGLSICTKHEALNGFVVQRSYIRPEMTEENGYICPAWTAIPKKSEITSVFLRYDWHGLDGKRIERSLNG